MASAIPTNTLPQETSTVNPTDPVIPPPAPKSIALITCSTRPGRINPSISAYILSLLTPLLPPSSSLTLTTIDLTTLSLPLLDEPTIPSALDKLNPTPHYLTTHARAWSSEIRKHDAFIFVTPQYNWSMPASIKNALDYLFWEWSGKPAFVVSYGGHGGGRSKDALEMVLKGLRMKVINGLQVTIKVPEDFVLGEVVGEEVKVVGEEMRAGWKEQGVESGVERAWREMLGMLGG
jgi:NAD(P)H-dependent FMN reductase